MKWTRKTPLSISKNDFQNVIDGGKNIDITHLHIKEWIDVIRNGGTTGCNIEKAFDDTVAVLMVHKSYVENRSVKWDPIKRKIV